MNFIIFKDDIQVASNLGKLQTSILRLQFNIGYRLVEIDNEKHRISFKEWGDYKCILVSSDPKLLSRKKFFVQAVDIAIDTIKELVKDIELSKRKYRKEYEEFIHNVVSLNSFSINSLFELVPQELLLENITTQEETISKIIVDNKEQAANSMLNLIKYTLATKVEFSVFERMNDQTTFKREQVFPIRRVFLTVLQIFMKDFKRKNILIHLDASERRLELDYESMLVSLYYLFENALKYVLPRTTIKIIFIDSDNGFTALMNMVSVKIIPSEVDAIFKRGVRGKFAIMADKEGRGIGLSRIVRTLKINDAKISVEPNAFEYYAKNKGIEYQGNRFRIEFINQFKI